MGTRKRVLIGVSGAAGLLVVVLLAFLAGSDSGNSGGRVGNDKLDHMVQSGDMQRMIAQHQAMLEQMRVSATPQMAQLMDADPMWQLMRTGEFTRVLEEHQREIDRMLGRGAPP